MRSIQTAFTKLCRFLDLTGLSRKRVSQKRSRIRSFQPGTMSSTRRDTYQILQMAAQCRASKIIPTTGIGRKPIRHGAAECSYKYKTKQNQAPKPKCEPFNEQLIYRRQAHTPWLLSTVPFVLQKYCYLPELVCPQYYLGPRSGCDRLFLLQP